MQPDTQRSPRPLEEDQTERGPGKTDGASVGTGGAAGEAGSAGATAGKFTSRSGRKSESEVPAKRSTVVSSANKQPGGRSPNGAGGPTAAAGTARKGHRIEAARQARAAH